MELVILLSFKQQIGKDTHLLYGLIDGMIVKLGVVYILYSHLDAFLLRTLSLVLFFLLLNTAVQDFVNFLESLGHSWFLRLDHNLRQNGRLSVLNFSASVSAAVIQSFYFFFLHKSCLSFGILRFNIFIRAKSYLIFSSCDKLIFNMIILKQMFHS